MGNTATIICGVRQQKELVTVLQANGKVLEFSQKVRAAELMLGHPHHLICNASAILSGESGTILPPKAYLQRGNIYLLLPLPVDWHSATRNCSSSSKGNLQRASRSSKNTKAVTSKRTTKFVISKQYLDKIMTHSENRTKEQNRAPAVAPKPTVSVKRRSSTSWTPALESISEVAA